MISLGSSGTGKTHLQSGVGEQFMLQLLPIGGNVSVFTTSEDWLKVMLQSKPVVSSPVIPLAGGQFKRVVDVGINIGQTSLKQGGSNTSWLNIITDKAGNLITTYPVAKPVKP